MSYDPWAFAAAAPPPQPQPQPQPQRPAPGAYGGPPPGVGYYPPQPHPQQQQQPYRAPPPQPQQQGYYGQPNPFPTAVPAPAPAPAPAAPYDPFASFFSSAPAPSSSSTNTFDASGLYPTPASTSMGRYPPPAAAAADPFMSGMNTSGYGGAPIPVASVAAPAPYDPFASAFAPSSSSMFMNQSGMAPPGASASASVNRSAYGAPSAYGGGNTTMMNNSSFASSNPFDVTNDDAGFFANTNKTSASGPPRRQPPSASTAARQQQQQPPPASAGAPPTADQQRLMRVASMLFERGLLMKGDKIFTQELVLQSNDRVCTALESAERDGNVVPLEAALAAARGRANDAADSDSDSSIPGARGGGGGKSMPQSKTSMSFDASSGRMGRGAGGGGGRGGAADSDDEDAPGIDSRRESFKVPPSPSGRPLEAPHPAAGGLTMALPPGMLMNSNGQFAGNILLRVSSKKMFRKWKPVYFCLDKQRLVVWNDRREAELGGSAPRAVFPLHACMWIAKPTLKKTYSLIDDGRRVYYTTLKENAYDVVSDAVAAGMDRPVAFTPALETRVVAKFGSHIAGEISAFAHAVYGVVLHHQREAKAAAAAKRGGS